MKHLKYFEKFGIIDDMEQQVSDYISIVNSNPNKKSFDLIYRMEVNNQVKEIPFVLLFNRKLRGDGEMETDDSNGKTTFKIFLKNRNDESTLLHEVKHIDYYNRIENCYNDLFFIANSEIDKDKDLKIFKMFYVYTENEYQAKYNSYYKDFDEYLKNIISNIGKTNLTPSIIVKSFNEFLKKHEDRTWTWYLGDREFKFKNYALKEDINLLFHKIIIPIMKNGKVEEDIDLTFYSISNMIKSAWNKIKELLFGRKKLEISEKEQIEINRAIKKLENNINRKKKRYNSKFRKMIPLMIEKYIK